MTKTLILIGGGNMGGAMASRWHEAGNHIIHVIEKDAARRDEFTANGIASHATLAEAPRGDIYVLAIKPQQFASYADELCKTLGHSNPLLISIMAGVPLAELHAMSQNAVRTMPNLPALIGEAMTVACAPNLDEKTREQVSDLFFLIGDCVWVGDEEKIHATTAISGSGPAYLFALMEAMQQAAIAQGLHPEMAREMITQTMIGAALLADHAGGDVTTLRRNVTSPGGTTEAALKTFASGNLEGLVGDAIAAAIARSKALANS